MACISVVFKGLCGKIGRMITLYGIPNCDTVKKARAWLAAQDLVHDFHNFKKQGVPDGKLAVWAESIGWDKLLNRNGTTWRKLGVAEQARATDEDGILALVSSYPSLIKRPVVEWETGAFNSVTAGFNAAVWTANAKNSANSAK